MKFNQKTIGAICFIGAVIAGGFGYKYYSNQQEIKAKAEAQAKADATPRWEYVSTSLNGSQFYIHLPAKKDQQNSDLKHTWVKIKTNKNETYEKYTWFNCSANSWASTYIKIYDKDGTLKNDGDINDKWAIASPDSIAQSEINLACK